MSNKDFATNVAKYFMDFLETNFHKRKAPRRVYRSRNEKSFLVGVNLNQFPHFKSELWKLVSRNFDKQEIVFKKGKHIIKISPHILKLVIQYCDNLKQEQLDKISNDINNLIHQLPSDFSEIKDKILEYSQNAICESFITPLIENITQLLQGSHSSEKDFFLGMEPELCALFTERLEDYIFDFLINSVTSKKAGNLNISSAINLERIKNEIKNHFESLKTDDLFFKMSDLLNNRQIIEKQEIYIYLFDIKYDNSVYPLFYMPIEVETTSDEIRIKFDTSIYINKKAVDFFTQKINEKQNSRGKIASIDNRVIYFSEEQDSLGSRLENIFNEILNYYKISSKFQIGRLTEQVFKSQSASFKISLTNNCYFGLFDKSDETLINDYEELIEHLKNESDALGQRFRNLLEGFLKENPIRTTSEVGEEWENTEASEKLVRISPIPLNDEQNQIIKALEKNSKYITVEGPPGTGKSHTITAIVFNAILNGKNTLVLSDKKEALDVVEDKITKTLNEVRLHEDFQNPILRLGKSGNTYNKILSTSSISKIKTHHKETEKNKEAQKKEVEKIKNELQDKIQKEIDGYSCIKISEILELEGLEGNLQKTNLLRIDEDELYQTCDIVKELKVLQSISIFFKDILLKDNIKLLNEPLEIYLKNPRETRSFLHLKKTIEAINEIIDSELNLESYSRIGGITCENISKLRSIHARLKEIGSGFFGYFLKGSTLLSLLKELHNEFTCPSIVNLKKEVSTLGNIIDLSRKFEENSSSVDFSVFLFDKYELLEQFLKLDFEKKTPIISGIYNGLVETENFIENFPKTSKNLGLEKGYDVILFEYAQIEKSDFEQVLRLYHLKKKITEAFKHIPQFNYVRDKKKIEHLCTTQMTNVLDGRVIDFFENSKSTATTLKDIIKSKKRFPKKEFKFLKEAFPCIISGIRDYAEYIPLEGELFDIVIIDEASQVSIAQALPALLRAKKVVVFGDKKQFSNIKSAQATSEINSQYKRELKDNYVIHSNTSSGELERLLKFDIKTSILDFFEYIGNYTIELKKHFRGYKELISYSSKYFYNNDLQAIKIRGKPINELIEFKFLDHDGKSDTIENTNSLEIEEIIKYLEDNVDRPEPPTIGIITPHTNQQKAILERINRHDRYSDFCSKNHLKIMTFDTCQGEEREHIVYSMVAHPGSDKLNYVFINDLKSIDIEEDNKIKAQRLNVGFSRSKEKMVFICSKPLTDYRGSIGEALRHYQLIIEKSKTIPGKNQVDKKSPMEAKVLDWIQETSFFKNNMVNIELKAQFPIGDYLKQINSTYEHPKYICDFLLQFSEQEGMCHDIIIEYDGFKEHFTDIRNVDKNNYTKYYNDEDVYRQKILEGYGYKFLRINKFNIGLDPIKTLDERLSFLIQISGKNKLN